MLKEEFIKKWKPRNTSENRFEQDLDSVIKDSWPKTFASYEDKDSHMTRCPYCKCYILYNDDAIVKTSIGGMIVKQEVHCDCCAKDVPLLAWRIL